MLTNKSAEATGTCADFGYEANDHWAQLPAAMSWREVAGVATDSADNVFVFNRGEHPVMVFNPDGTFLRSWGEGIIARAHGITIGPDDAVYCVDDLGHTVRKFTREGKLLLTLGTSGQPSDTGATSMDFRSIVRAGAPFHYPTNLALSATGEMYVSDGYGNARMHKFSADGRLLFSWGEPGSGPGQFKVPHGVAVDKQGTVLVADRENSRIQLFTPEGKFISEWTDVARPDQIFIDAAGDIYVAELGFYAGMWPGTTAPSPDATGGRVSIYDRNGSLKARWGGGKNPCAPGDFFAPHGICCDSRGDIYVGEVTMSAGGNKGAGARNVPFAPEIYATRQIMKSWRFYGFNDMRMDEIPPPVRKPGAVLVEPLCVQPSVTEAQLAKGIPTLAYDRIKRRFETEAPVQLFGHEFCARVLESEKSSPFQPGDRVAARAKLPCGVCPLCRAERSYLCRKGPVIGFDLPGCFSEIASIPEIALVRVDDRISDSEAACLQSLSDSVAAVETAQLQMADSVVIFGQGSMGLECLQIARISRAGLVITVDVRKEACDMSRELGADHALNATECDVVATIRDLTGGNGADVVFECAGGSPKQGLAGHKTLLQALESTRSGGKIIGVSWFGGPLELNIDFLRERSSRYLFPDISTQAHLEHTVRLVASGRVRLKPTITHILSGIESAPEAFEITANKGVHKAINPAQVMFK